MKRLLLLALIGFAAWFGWNHWRELFTRVPLHEVQVTNVSTSGIVRLRVTVGGQTFVKEELAPGASATWPFQVRDDSDFRLVWNWSDKIGEAQWSGGRVTRGPVVQHHEIRIDGDGGVVYTFADKPGADAKP